MREIEIFQGIVLRRIEDVVTAYFSVKDPTGRYVWTRKEHSPGKKEHRVTARPQFHTAHCFCSRLLFPKEIVRVTFALEYDPEEDPADFQVESKDEFLLPQLKLGELLEKAEARPEDAKSILDRMLRTDTYRRSYANRDV